MPQLPFVGLIVAGALAGILSANMVLTTLTNAPTSITLNPSRGTIEENATVTITVHVASEIPVNVFQGLINFDQTRFSVERIDYNTSIADLWAEEPWYENGDGTISFIGGTTIAGGFTGTGDLMTITFKSIAPGSATIALTEARILKHDGLGSDARVAAPIDALFNVTPEALTRDTVLETQAAEPSTIDIIVAGRSTDLSGDGRNTITDVSIFMRHLANQNTASDFNGDGIVSTKDLSIILNQ